MWIVSTDRAVGLGVDGEQHEPIGTLADGSTVFEVPAEVGLHQVRHVGWRLPTDEEDQLLLATAREAVRAVEPPATGDESPGGQETSGDLQPTDTDPAALPPIDEDSAPVEVPADGTEAEVRDEIEPEPAPAKKTTRRRKTSTEGA